MKNYRDELTGELFQLEGGKLYHDGEVVAETEWGIAEIIELYDLEEV